MIVKEERLGEIYRPLLFERECFWLTKKARFIVLILKRRKGCGSGLVCKCGGSRTAESWERRTVEVVSYVFVVH